MTKRILIGYFICALATRRGLIKQTHPQTNSIRASYITIFVHILECFIGSSVTMSSRTLPLLFINLGGEMLYILDQRLRAQNIPADKAKKGS